MKPSVFLLNLAIVLTCVGCSKEKKIEKEDEPEIRENVMSFTTGGQSFAFENGGVVQSGVGDTITFVGIDYYLREGIVTPQSFGHFIISNVPIKVGEYQVNDGIPPFVSEEPLFMWEQHDTIPNDGITEICDRYFTYDDPEVPNVISVDEVDFENEIISGTFKLAIYRVKSCDFFNYGDTLQITDGKYYLKGW